MEPPIYSPHEDHMKFARITLAAAILMSWSCGSEVTPSSGMPDAFLVLRDAAPMDVSPGPDDRGVDSSVDSATAIDSAPRPMDQAVIETDLALDGGPTLDQSVTVSDSTIAGDARPMDLALAVDATPDVNVPAPDAAPDMDVPVPDAAPDANVSAPDGAVAQADMSADASAPDAAPPAPSVCPEDTRLVGEYAEWCGKVDVHRSVGGEWLVDGDCNSGCGQQQLPYCRKFWPEASAVVEIPVSPEDKPFTTARCLELVPRRGSIQFACCAPN